MKMSPLRNFLEAGNHPQRGRFAAARGPDEDDELPICDLEADVFDRGDVAAFFAGINLEDVFDRDFGHEQSRQTRDGPEGQIPLGDASLGSRIGAASGSRLHFPPLPGYRKGSATTSTGSLRQQIRARLIESALHIAERDFFA